MSLTYTLQTKHRKEDDWRQIGLRSLSLHDAKLWFKMHVRFDPYSYSRIIDEWGAPVEGLTHRGTHHGQTG